jgi:hypothetical protein
LCETSRAGELGERFLVLGEQLGAELYFQLQDKIDRARSAKGRSVIGDFAAGRLRMIFKGLHEGRGFEISTVLALRRIVEVGQ